MKITSIALPDALAERIAETAEDAERSRSWVIAKLLSRALTGRSRLEALQAIATAGLDEYNAPRDKAANASAVISESCADGRARLDGLSKIANGGR